MIARIGPNAITRMAEAIEGTHGTGPLKQVFDGAGLLGYLHQSPGAMVPEQEVVHLHRSCRQVLGAERARALGAQAGRLTGEYLLGNRIPAAARWMLRRLPAGLAARALLAAVARHTWTFAGSGEFSARAGHPVRLRMGACPICRGAEARVPLCDYYAATFEQLFRALVSPRAQARETACQATGAPACLFEIRWH